MSKHNYSQYSNKNTPNNQNVQHEHNVHQSKPIEKTEVEITPVKPVENVVIAAETVETVSLPAIVTGKVARCSKLNVREKPIVTSDIVCVLDVASEVKVDVKKSGENWFYVYCANGAEGYCMKEYIDARM